MKKLILIASIAALAACSKPAENAPEATASTEAAPAAAAGEPTLADMVGIYEVKGAKGEIGSTVINADGTYVDTDAAGKQIKGTFARKDGKDCFDPEGDAAEECFTTTEPAADGTFTATGPSGPVTVKKVS